MTTRFTTLASLVLLTTACGGTVPPAPDALQTTGSETTEAPSTQAADAGLTLTAAECEERGGHIVGDIGDGAIHRLDYRCPDSGEPPIGRIQVEPGAPVPIEGAVCCP